MMAEHLLCVRFAPEHIPHAADLEALCFAHPWSEQSLTMLCHDGNVGFSVLSMPEGRVVAYGGMLTVLDEGQILNVAVHPDYRRRGCGARILQALISYAEQNQLSLLTLEVRASNRAAIALYEKYGFVRSGLRRNFYTSPTEDAHLMSKSIPHPEEFNR